MISILWDLFEKDFECIKTLNKLPNSCKSIVYCLMLAYEKRILIKRDKTQIYLNIDYLYKFIKRVANPFIKSFSDMYDSCQILQDYGIIKESLTTHNPKLSKIKLWINLRDVEEYFGNVLFLFAGNSSN